MEPTNWNIQVKLEDFFEQNKSSKMRDPPKD